jgi:hypothetical protein
MRHIYIAVLLILTVGVAGLYGQNAQPEGGARSHTTRWQMKGAHPSGVEINGSDTIYKYSILPVYVFSRKKDMRQHERLVRNVLKVYPYAKDARRYMDRLQAELPKLKTKKERDRYTKLIEKEIIKNYTPVLKKMTFSQGKILIKLIDRETQQTSYEILREFHGGFSAGFWNTIARLFKADLKQVYDKTSGEDQIIEQIIILHEAGLL